MYWIDLNNDVSYNFILDIRVMMNDVPTIFNPRKPRLSQSNAVLTSDHRPYGPFSHVLSRSESCKYNVMMFYLHTGCFILYFTIYNSMVVIICFLTYTVCQPEDVEQVEQCQRRQLGVFKRLKNKCCSKHARKVGWYL